VIEQRRRNLDRRRTGLPPSAIAPLPSSASTGIARGELRIRKFEERVAAGWHERRAPSWRAAGSARDRLSSAIWTREHVAPSSASSETRARAAPDCERASTSSASAPRPAHSGRRWPARYENAGERQGPHRRQRHGQRLEDGARGQNIDENTLTAVGDLRAIIKHPREG